MSSILPQNLALYSKINELLTQKSFKNFSGEFIFLTDFDAIDYKIEKTDENGIKITANIKKFNSLDESKIIDFVSEYFEGYFIDQIETFFMFFVPFSDPEPEKIANKFADFFRQLNLFLFKACCTNLSFFDDVNISSQVFSFSTDFIFTFKNLSLETIIKEFSAPKLKNALKIEVKGNCMKIKHFGEIFDEEILEKIIFLVPNLLVQSSKNDVFLGQKIKTNLKKLTKVSSEELFML